MSFEIKRRSEVQKHLNFIAILQYFITMKFSDSYRKSVKTHFKLNKYEQ